MILKNIRISHCLLTARLRAACGGLMATMLKVEVEKGGFYVSRHDAKLSTGVLHDGRSAGMVRQRRSRSARRRTAAGSKCRT